MYWRTFKICVLKYMNLIPLVFFFLFFFSAPGSAWQAALKMTKVKLDLLTDINILPILEKGIKLMFNILKNYMNFIMIYHFNNNNYYYYLFGYSYITMVLHPMTKT